MDHRIIGTTMPVLEMNLNPGEVIFAESGELSWLSQSIVMQTTTSAGGQKGGFFAAVGRALSGGTLFMTDYAAQGGPGLVSFAAKLPGQIIPVPLQGGPGVMVHRHGFMCATHGVQFSMGVQQKLGAGIFGGTGFIMQKLAGQGLAFVELHGEVVPYDLPAGGTLRVHPGHVGMFQETVQLNLTTVPGIKNALFGGDGLFLATLTGPGRVWLQSMCLSNLAHAIAQYLPQREDKSGLSFG
jgi:uncharacterized protein (TIGR00266 family)